MNKSQRILLGVAIVAVGAVVVTLMAQKGVFTPKSNNEKTAVKIGAILPLSGDVAVVGEEVKKGIEIAQAEAKAGGYMSEVIYEDDKFDPAVASSAANKLLNVDRVDIGLTAIVEEAQPIMPIFNSAKIPLLITWDSNEPMRQAGDYIFSTGFSTELTGQKMAEYSYQKLGLRRVGIVSHVNPFSEIISQSFADKFKMLGGEIVMTDKQQMTETDYRTSIAKLKNLNPDGVYIPLIPPTSAEFLIQAHELGLNAKLLSADALLQDVIDAAGPAAEGIYYTNIFTDKTAELTNKYKQKFGSDPLDVTLVSFGYDGFNAIKDAAENSGRDNIPQGLLKVVGQKRTTDRVEKIYKVVNGQPQLAE